MLFKYPSPLIFLLFSAIFFTMLTGCSEDENIELGNEEAFVKFFGGVGQDEGNGVLQLADGGYILVGSSNSFSNPIGTNFDVFVVRTDALGNEMWSNAFDNAGLDDFGNSIQPAADSSFMIVGTTSINSSDSDMFLIHIDNKGQEISSRTFATNTGSLNAAETGNELRATADGGFILMGEVNDPNDTDAALDMFIVKVDATGQTVEWQRTYGFENELEDTGISILEALNGDFIWFGSNEKNENDKDLRVVRSNSIGNLRWDNSFGSESNEIGGQIQLDIGGYIMVGTQGDSGNGDIFLVQINESGEEQWSVTLDVPEDQLGISVSPIVGGGYIVVGQSQVPASDNNNVFLARLTSGPNPDIMWQREFGGSGFDIGGAVIQSQDGGFAMTGSSEFENNPMMVLIKTDENGLIVE